MLQVYSRAVKNRFTYIPLVKAIWASGIDAFLAPSHAIQRAEAQGEGRAGVRDAVSESNARLHQRHHPRTSAAATLLAPNPEVEEEQEDEEAAKAA
jgi:hypothetical protein